MSSENVTEQPRRFKHQSYQAQIKNVHLPSPLTRNTVDQKIDDDQSHFHLALEQWRQLNLAPAFLEYAKKSNTLSASLPLLLHNWEALIDLWLDAVVEADLESKQPLLDLLQKLIHDLRTTLMPKYESIWTALLSQASRSLPPATLETYIQTLSLFLKYLLLPKPSNLVVTWNKLAGTVKKCRPDIQRMLAEVWATVLRRLKSDSREEVTAMLVKSLDTIQDAVAWIYIAGFQTASTMLHTSTVPLLNLLWDAALQADSFEDISTLMRRILTATMHYCSPESFRPVADLVTTRVESLETTVLQEERVHRTLQMTLVVAALRKGKKAESMFTADQITVILSKISSVPLSDGLKEDMGTMLVACLKGSEMSLWARGRAALEHVWKDTHSGYRVAWALSKLDQSKGANWRAFMLPYVQKAILSRDPLYLPQTLDLLHGLATDGRLLFNDDALKNSVEEICRGVLEQWTLREASVLQLRDILTLVPLFPALGRPLSGLVDTLIQSSVDSGQDYRNSAANAAWCLGSSMLALSKVKGWNEGLDVDSWIENCLQNYSWSSKVLEGLNSISHLSNTAIPFVEALSALRPAIMSHIGALRYQSLRLLASRAVERDSSQNLAVTSCLQAESVEIASTRTPERVLKTTKVGAFTPVGQSGGSTELCTRWLIAQLKVNLMPLWKVTAQALGVLFDRCGEEIWPIFKAELYGVFDGNKGSSNNPSWVSERASPGQSYQEDEKTWRNPGLNETVVALQGLGRGMTALVQDQQISDRFDTENYEKQLLKTLEGRPTYAERHNRDLVPLFLSFASPDLPTRPRMQRLSSWLALFAKFANPKAVYASQSLHSLYISLLSHPERPLQSIAVDCLLSYKSKALKAHESTIRGLLDDNQWKDHLMALELSGTVEPSDRAEYVDFLVRLLYGMIRERRGRNKLQDRRATLLGALRQCADGELGTLVRLMLEPFGMTEDDVPMLIDVPELPTSLTWKQQVGFLVLQAEVTRLLGLKLTMYWPSLLWATMSVTASAQRILEGVKAKPDEEPLGDAESADGDAASDTDGTGTPHKVARNLRQLGIKRITEYFRLAGGFDFKPYMPASFKHFISPRLEALEMENTQSPSSIMELFYTWSGRADQVILLVDYDANVLPKIFACLTAKNVKPSVISRVLDIVENVFTGAHSNEDLINRLVRPHLSLIIDNLTVVIKETNQIGATSSEISQRYIRTLRIISDHVTDSQHASSLLPLLLPLLQKPTNKVNENVKVDLLQVVSRLLSLLEKDLQQTAALSKSVYETVSHLLQTLSGRQARVSAAQVFSALASKAPEMVPLASLIQNLNAFDEHRPEEPDFDRRMDAFTRLNEQLYSHLESPQWLPILHNMLHFIHDRNELSIRNNAAYTMRRFIQILKNRPSEELRKLFSRVLFVGLKNGLRTKHEMVRTELISVLAFAVRECPELPSLYDMKSLLADGDEEASFFNNISHVQIHRRTRALRRLSDHCDQGHLRSSTLNEVFAPIVGHYIGDPSLDHLLVNEAISTMGHIARQLVWSRYYALVQRYIKLVKEKSSGVKYYVRTVITLLDNFHFSMEEVVEVSQQDEEVQEDIEGELILEPKPSLSLKIADAVNGRLLPALLRFLEKREETEDTMRIPMAVGIAKVALHLPEEKQRLQVTRLMTVLCQALRSKSSETRDLTRDTLCKIVASAGPPYLPILVQELRVALTRGPQLHILAVTCHSLVFHVTTLDALEKGFTHLDDVAGDVAQISTEVIFGQSGKDVQGEDFKTTFREVRSSSAKGLDTLTILARYITPGCVARLLLPLRSIMHETESVKTMQVVEESLKRIASGLNSNSSLDAKALLSLCHTLIGQNAKFLQEKPDIRRKGGLRKNFVVQAKRDLPQASEHYAHNSYRFVAFGLELLVVAFRRNRFDYHDAEIISRLEPMVNLIGNALYSNAAPVVVLGLRAVAAIVKAPLQAIPKALPVIVHQQVEIIRQAGSAESEAAQASLKSLASTLRDCPTAQLKESDLKYVLAVMEPDLEEVERQAAVFALLRAIIQRKLVVPEIYDMLDRVANVVITNQSTQVQEMCRGILLQFLLDYPQGKGRLRKQMTFLASNLSYIFESGRLSVMILLDAIFQKFEQKLVAEYADMFFMALVMVLANDDSLACRERASNLIKVLYKVLEPDQRGQLMGRLHVWVTQSAQGSLARVAAQSYGLVIEVSVDDVVVHFPAILSDLNQILEHAVEQQAELGVSAGDAMEVDLDWQTSYHALIVLCKMFKSSRETEMVANEVSWEAVVDLMVFPHAWVRSACSKLLGAFYASPRNSIVDVDSGAIHPATRRGMVTIAKNSSIQLRSEHLDQAFSLQIVKNLVFVGKSFYDGPGTREGGEGGEPGGSQDSDSETSGDEGGEHGQRSKEERIVQAPLPWLFSKLSYQVKTAHLKRRNSFAAPKNWYLEPLAILQWFAAMVSHLDVDGLERYLVHILTPVYRLTEDDTVRDSSMDEVKTVAQELQDLVQGKVGITKFTAIYGQIRQGTLTIRRERKAARAMTVASNPQGAAIRQIQRNVAKRESRKRKSHALKEAKATAHFPSKRKRVD